MSPFKHSLPVRFADVDMLGHVNNAVYFTYIEECRTTFFRSLGYKNNDFQKECPIILAHAECGFKSPAFFGENLDIQLRVGEIKNASFSFEYEIYEQKSKRLVAVAKTIQVTFNYAQMKVIPIPDTLRKKLLGY